MNRKHINEVVLSVIPVGRKNAITGKELIAITGLKRRRLKEVITDLRHDHPICSKETGGGGYWIADNRMDIREFISMISARRMGYDHTINKMVYHLENDELPFV